MERLLAKLNRLTAWQAAIILLAIGLSVFFVGLKNPFQGDDSFQIVNNLPVHSVKNIPLLFKSSTFYNGQKLEGIYYRPLMSTTFSVIYTFFGSHPLAYHVVQLLIYLASALILYLVFSHFFKPALSLLLSLIFLVHPMNSQIVYSIPTMQDALFFFFGILALLILIHFNSHRSIVAVACCLLLSLFSKESAVVFVVVSFLYLALFDRSRLRTLALTMVLPITTYLLLKINAVGFVGKSNLAPIDSLNFIGRVLTIPSVVLFYFSKFVFPWNLATGYYWVHPNFSIKYVLLPFTADLIIIGLFVYLGRRIRRKLSREAYHIYLFFAAWTAGGIALYTQIIPLDMTACETWFYFPMAGVLGMIGVASLTYQLKIHPAWVLLAAAVLIVLLGTRSLMRGTDYRSQYNLALHDVAVSADNYAALNNVAQGLIEQQKYSDATTYAQQSAEIHPSFESYDDLGVARQQLGDYEGAAKAYKNALKYGDFAYIVENLGQISLDYGNPANNIQFFKWALSAYPQNNKIWLYYAIFEDSQGDNANAKLALATAAKFGPVPQVLYEKIMDNLPFTLSLTGGRKVIVR